MAPTDNQRYRAYAARDARFDGVFFVGVTSTGIYCRPVCTARTPKEANCRFFDSAEAAEKASFRPCLRCRPELAPGSAPVDDASRIAELIVQRAGEGFDEATGIEEIAAQFELSSRQLRRIVARELGLSPIELVQTRRLLLAKQLLTETRLPIVEIAFASGFSSLRRFNGAFKERYGFPPSRLRGDESLIAEKSAPRDILTLRLGYRAPFDWKGTLEFLRNRALKGVERVEEECYARTVRLGRHAGGVAVRNNPSARALQIEISRELAPVLPALLTRLKHLFDLNARPDLIDRQLSGDARLTKHVKRVPGLRVPGAFDGFELAVRAILGQQVTVKAATTLAGRFVEAFGESGGWLGPGPAYLAPTPERVAAARIGELTRLGIIEARARAIVALAREVTSGSLELEAGSRPERACEQLVDLLGIGPWTAHYIAMRALRWPDAFPKEDIALRKALGGVSASEAEQISQAWRPWRSYATLHLWRSLASGGEGTARGARS